MNTPATLSINGSAVLTHSRMASFRRCAREHYFRYELGVRPSHSGVALTFGKSIHRGLETLAKTRDIDKAIHDATAEYHVGVMQAETIEQADAIEVQRETVIALLRGYHAAWPDDGNPDAEHGMTPVEFIAVEQEFRLPVENPETSRTSRTFEVAGKIDSIVQLKDGRCAIMEHKTTSDTLDMDSDYWVRLRIDSQISLYMIAGKAIGHPVETILYDVIRKPGISPKQIALTDDAGVKIVVDRDGKRVFKKDGTPRESSDAAQGFTLKTRIESPAEFGARLTEDIKARPEFYYARKEIPRLTADLDEARWELWQQAQAIREAQKAERWIRNSQACIGFGRCAYLSICHNGIDPDHLPSGFIKLDTVHPELELSE